MKPPSLLLVESRASSSIRAGAQALAQATTAATVHLEHSICQPLIRRTLTIHVRKGMASV